MQVNVLVELMIETCGDIFGEDTAGPSCPSADESLAPLDRSTGMRRSCGLSQTGAWDTRNLNVEKTTGVDSFGWLLL